MLLAASRVLYHCSSLSFLALVFVVLVTQFRAALVVGSLVRCHVCLSCLLWLISTSRSWLYSVCWRGVRVVFLSIAVCIDAVSSSTAWSMSCELFTLSLGAISLSRSAV